MDCWTHPEDHDSEARGDPRGFAPFCTHRAASLQDVFGDISKSLPWWLNSNDFQGSTKKAAAVWLRAQVASTKCAEYAEGRGT